MPKYLKDGESRKMKPNHIYGPEGFHVIAKRVDSETPYVILRPLKAKDESQDVYLTDVGCQDLIDRLSRALSILPSSK